jgi:hypothetical protein
MLSSRDVDSLGLFKVSKDIWLVAVGYSASVSCVLKGDMVIRLYTS